MTSMVRRRIDPAGLALLAADPKLSAVAIAAEFDLPVSAFYAQLGHSERLAEIYARGRMRAGRPIFSIRKLRAKRRPLSDDERRIVGAIADGLRRMCEVVAATGLEPNHAGALLYNLENERHAIWSKREGLPAVTRYFLRAEEESNGNLERAPRKRRGRSRRQRRSRLFSDPGEGTRKGDGEIGRMGDGGTGRRREGSTGQSERSPSSALAVSPSTVVVSYAADALHLATEAQVGALDKLFGFLDWSPEGVEKFVYQRFQQKQYRMLSVADANSLTMILLNVAAARAIKERGGAQRVSRAMIKEEIPSLKERLGIEDTSADLLGSPCGRSGPGDSTKAVRSP